MSVRSLLRLIPVLPDAGISTPELFDEFGLAIDDLTNIEKRIPYDTLVRIWERAAELAGDPFLSLEAVERSEIADYGLFGYIVANARDIAQATDRMIEYQKLWTDGAWVERAGDSEMRHVYVNRLHQRSVQMNHLVMPTVYRLGCMVAGSQVKLTEAGFAHSDPGAPDVYERFYGCPVAFDAPYNYVRFDRSVRDLPLIHADDVLGNELVKIGQRMFERMGIEASFEAKVRRAIVSHLYRGDVRLVTVASALATTPRTLQRQLERDGTYYQTLVDDVRRELAHDYLMGGAGVEDVAFALGFSSLSSFFRAFQRWTGRTPREYVAASH